MTAERTFTYRERGAMLAAIGKQMMQNDLCVGAALDGNSDNQMISDMMKNGIDEVVARELCNVDIDILTSDDCAMSTLIFLLRTTDHDR